MKKGLCITFYNPSEEDIINLQSKLDIFDSVYIYDNSEDNNVEERVKLFSSNKIYYFYNNHNDGLSIAFNKCCEKAINDRVDLLMFLDQDSNFSNESINSLFAKAEELATSKDFGMIGPRIIYRGKEDKKSISPLEEKEWIITSGSILSIKAFREVGYFDENYFINFIEPDICLELSKKGFKTYCYNQVTLEQELGIQYKKGKKTILIHSPLRNYYGHRNRLYFLSKHKKDLSFSLKLHYRLASIMDYFRFNPEKKLNRKYLKKARLDYKKKIFGKIDYEF